MKPVAGAGFPIVHLHAASHCVQRLPFSKTIGGMPQRAALHLGSQALRGWPFTAPRARSLRNDRSVRCSLAGLAGAADLGIGRPRAGRISELSERRSFGENNTCERIDGQPFGPRRHAPDSEEMKPDVFEVRAKPPPSASFRRISSLRMD
jgi:hypothetical protein